MKLLPIRLWRLLRKDNGDLAVSVHAKVWPHDPVPIRAWATIRLPRVL